MISISISLTLLESLAKLALRIMNFRTDALYVRVTHECSTRIINNARQHVRAL